MDLGLNGKLALVTGSTTGIGAAIAEGLVRERARVIVNGRTEYRVQKAIEAIKTRVEDAARDNVLKTSCCKRGFQG